MKKHLTTTSIVLLVTLLCTFVSHAEHFSFIYDVEEIQQCQLCQNNINTPPENKIVFENENNSWLFKPSAPVSFISTKPVFIRPLLRAPPL